MLKIIITSASIRNVSGIAKATLKPYDIDFQDAWFHLIGADGVAEPFPQKVEIMLQKSKDGSALFYPVGDYLMDPSSIYVDRTGKLALSPRLIPVQKPARPA